MNVNANLQVNEVFLIFCQNDDLYNSQILHDMYKSILIEPEPMHTAMVNICGNGYLDMAKWLYGKYQDCITSGDVNEFFESSCINGQLEMAKWISHQMAHSLDIDDNIDEIFKITCLYNHLEVAKWLYEKYTHIDIRMENDYIFHNICNNKRHDKSYSDMIYLLCQICPPYLTKFQSR